MQSDNRIKGDGGESTSQLLLSAEHARMSVDLSHDVLDLQRLQVKVHLFAVLCGCV
jgi:hypothetical protein